MMKQQIHIGDVHYSKILVTTFIDLPEFLV